MTEDLSRLTGPELEALRADATAAQHSMNEAKVEAIKLISSINDEIKNRKNKYEIHVTDHAVIRYLERVKGIDVSLIRSEIAAIAEPYKHLKPPIIKFNGGVLAMSGLKVTTVLDRKVKMLNYRHFPADD